MRCNVKNRMWALALAVGLGSGIFGTAQIARAQWQQDRDDQNQVRQRDQDRDYNDQYQGQHSEGYYRNRAGVDVNNPWYQRGMQDAQDDRANNRGRHYRNRTWDDDNDRRAYEYGYTQGWGEQGYYGDPNPDRDRDGTDNGGYYGQQGVYSGSLRYYGDEPPQAFRYGYQDGRHDGMAARQSGRGSNPTGTENYKKADRGYYHGFGDKNAYRNTYRQGYEQGYQEGYSSGYYH